MSGAIWVAARFLNRRELHNFDACPVWVVGIQAVFAVAADFRAVECLQTVQPKLARGSKRHLVCDGRGIPLAIHLTGANRNMAVDWANLGG